MGAERLSGRAGPQEEERQDLSIGPHSPKLGYLHARHPGADFQPQEQRASSGDHLYTVSWIRGSQQEGPGDSGQALPMMRITLEDHS